jgi:hypothetical protein
VRRAVSCIEVAHARNGGGWLFAAKNGIRYMIDEDIAMYSIAMYGCYNVTPSD